MPVSGSLGLGPRPRQEGARRKPGFPLRPTGEGVRLLLLLALMGFACLNTRNNLLYLMFSVSLATVVVSAAAGWLSLRKIEVETDQPPDLFAGAACEERLRVKNRSRLFDCYGLELEELDFPGTAPRGRLVRLGRGREASLTMAKKYPRRGVFESRRLRLTTGFPFGLLRVTRPIQLARRLTVYPPVKRVDISFVFRGRSGPVPQRQRVGGSEELFRMRDYAFGDNLRYLDWKATAKLGRLMVREFASEEQRSFSILFDNTAPPGGGGAAEAERFETMVSAAASLASHLVSHRFAFRFVSADADFSPGLSPEHLRGVLTYLAGVRLMRAPAHHLVDRAREAMRGEEVILLLPGHPQSLLMSLASPDLHLINPGVLILEEAALGI